MVSPTCLAISTSSAFSISCSCFFSAPSWEASPALMSSSSILERPGSVVVGCVRGDIVSFGTRHTACLYRKAQSWHSRSYPRSSHFRSPFSATLQGFIDFPCVANCIHVHMASQYCGFLILGSCRGLPGLRSLVRKHGSAKGRIFPPLNVISFLQPDWMLSKVCRKCRGQHFGKYYCTRQVRPTQHQRSTFEKRPGLANWSFVKLAYVCGEYCGELEKTRLPQL
jgi:hypothetical protein